MDNSNHFNMIKVCIRAAIALVLFLFFSLVNASNDKQLPILHFQTYLIEDGLSQSTINDITQDNKGFMWFATYDGINRYDGYKFETYRMNEQEVGKSKSSFITALESSENRLWVGTLSKGLFEFDLIEKKYRAINFSLPNTNSRNLKIKKLKAINKELLIILTKSNGIISLSSFPNQKPSANIVVDNSADVRDFAVDNYGSLWFINSKGIFSVSLSELGQKNSEHLKPRQRSESSHLSAIDIVDFQLTAVSLEGSVIQRDIQNDKEVKFESGIQLPTTVKLLDSEVLMIGTKNDGVVEINLKTLNITHKSSTTYDRFSIADNYIHSLFIDKDQNFWVGTEKGLSKHYLSSRRFQHFKLNHDLNGNAQYSNMVWSIINDQNSLLLGTQSGLNFITPENINSGKRELYSQMAKLLGRLVIYQILKEKEDYLFATNRGVFLIKTITKSESEILSTSFFDTRETNSILLLDNGKVLAGTGSGGLQLIQPDRGNSKRYNITMLGKADKIFYRLQKLESGEIIALSSSGIDFLTPELEFTSAPELFNPVQDETVTCFLVDSKQRTWVATADGLFQFDVKNNNYKQFSTVSGLQSNQITGLVEDKTGTIWLSSTNGLSKYNSEEATFSNFAVSEGLQSSEFNRGAYSILDGKAVFGGINGLNIVDFEERYSNFPSPTPIVTSIVGDKLHSSEKPENFETFLPTEYIETVTADFSNSSITFEMSANNFKRPDYTLFEYKLENYDEIPNIVSAENRLATYRALPPGEYNFKVKAYYKGSTNYGRAKSIKLVVLPPIWRTWWAYLIYIFIIALFIYYYNKSHKLRLEREKAINKQLIESDRIKDEFLAKTSHELRTPLNGIIGLSESLNDGLAGELPEKAKENIALIAKSGRRLSNLVNDILDHSQLQYNEIRLNKKPVQLAPVVDVVIAICSPLSQLKNINLKNNLPENLPLVIADEERIEQILVNLVSNAIRHTNEGSITIEGIRDGCFVKIIVLDTGSGLKSNKKDYLFESFTQEEDKEKPNQGIGLGLSICKHLVELHGGKISAANRSCGGSKFEFSIPVSKARNLAQNNSQSSNKERKNNSVEPYNSLVETRYLKGKGPRILLADDEQINRQVLVGFLSPKGYEINIVSNGKDALSEIKENDNFDLIILDVIMPKLSGYDVCKEIRKRYNYFELPILMLSAKTQPNDIVTGLKSGANDYIGKPVDKLEFLARVETLINLKQVHLLRQERDDAIKQADRNLQLALKNAMHDPLTNLANRESFPLKLRKAIQQCEVQSTALSLLFISADRFKVINELHGHEFGDRVLKRIAQTLQDSTRESDMIFRYENDTFAIIISNLENYRPRLINIVSVIFEKMLCKLKEPVTILNKTIELSATAGSSIYPFDSTNYADLISFADSTLQSAKANKRGSLLFYTPEISHQKQSRLKLETELEHALKNDLLELYYQPQSSAKTGHISGAEALIRWNHPEQGMVSPAEFIPIAEECGLIIPIGRWIIQQACKDVSQLKRKYIAPPHVAINLSGHQFKDELLVEHLRKQIEFYQLDTSQIALEITEGVLMDDVESTMSKLQSFKAMGHKISIDDFGTGYSSLSYLKQFPIDTLKIDQSFIKEIENDSESQVIVKSIMELAKGLKLLTIAEGVETQPQLELLKYLECDFIQGYFFSKPLNLNDFEEFLKKAAQRRA